MELARLPHVGTLANSDTVPFTEPLILFACRFQLGGARVTLESNTKLMNILVQIGRVSDDLEVAELTIRGIHDEDEWLPDFDDDYGPVIPRTELRVQGRIVNKTARPLTNLCYDVSYYGRDGQFLGLDRSSLLEDDDLDPDDSLPIDMPLSMPEETHRCVFNARARRRRWPGRLF